MTGLTFKELEYGNVVKVVLANRTEFKGIYVGALKYNDITNDWAKAEKGHFLLVFNVIDNKPQIVNIPFYSKQYKTRVTELARTRLTRDLSEYLRRYLGHYQKQQDLIKQMHELNVQKTKHETFMQKIEDEGQAVALPDSELTGHELFKLYVSFKHNGYKGKKEDVTIKMMNRRLEITLDNINLMAKDVGLRHTFGYDGASHFEGGLTITESLKRKMKKQYPFVTFDNINAFMEDINKIEGVSVEPAGNLGIFKVVLGEFDGGGSIGIKLIFTVSNTFTAVDEVLKVVDPFMKKIAR